MKTIVVSLTFAFALAVFAYTVVGPVIESAMARVSSTIGGK